MVVVFTSFSTINFKDVIYSSTRASKASTCASTALLLARI
jgi:hypothetical protein